MAKPKNEDRVSCLCLASPAACVFEGAGEPGIFSVPEPRVKLGIVPNPRAYMEEAEE